MKLLEPRIMELITEEAMTTTDVARELYGEEGEWKVYHERAAVFSTLRAMERNGYIESRLCDTNPMYPPSRYWALPGGRFPSQAESSITERVYDALTDEPTRIDIIFNTVLSDEERANYTNGMKRLNKALNRLLSQGRAAKGDDEQFESKWFTTWKKGSK